MLISVRRARIVLGLLPLVATLGEAPQPHRVLQIRVSQETSPGAGDFDHHVLGFITALQTDGGAADFYMYGNQGPNYGNSAPVLQSNTCHLFFVNASDGLALFLVNNKSNRNENSNGGTAYTRFDLSGGTASVLKSDDEGEGTSDEGGTVFYGKMDWAGSNTDGMVIGALPVGFTILGQFTQPPAGLGGGWEVISSDGSIIPLQMTVGQRVRLDVHLTVEVRQGP